MQTFLITESQYFKLLEKVSVDNYTEYAKNVAVAYNEAVNYDPSAVSHWKALNASNYIWWKRLISEAKIVFVTSNSKYKNKPSTLNVLGKSYTLQYLDGEPYATASEMSNSFKKDNILYISIDHSDHPVFSLIDNIVFRTVHDYIVHIKGNYEFGIKGEIASYNLHAKLAPNDALPALFTEIVGQASYAVTFGSFPIQKIVVLKQFDFNTVGKYTNETKQYS